MKTLKYLLTTMILTFSMATFAQNVASTNVNALTLKSYTQLQRGLITNPKTGMIIYQSDGIKGVYSYNGTGWVLDYPGNNSQWIDNAGNLTYSNGNIGIGTANPPSKLHVVGDRVGIESPSPTVYMKNTINGYGINALEFSPNNDLKVANGAILVNAGGGPSTVYVQNNNGNVGIGTSTPTAKLQVVGNVKLGGSVPLVASPYIQPIATDSSIKSGLWSDPTIWSNGTIPDGLTKRVKISTNTNVRLDTNIVVDSVFVMPHSQLQWMDNKSLNNVIKEGSMINGYVPTKINQRNGKYSDLGVWGASLPLATDEVLINDYSFVQINKNVRVSKMVIRWNAYFDVYHNKSLNGIKYLYYR